MTYFPSFPLSRRNLEKSKVAIVSYGLFQYKRFYTLLKNQKITFKVIVCDEAHYLKVKEACFLQLVRGFSNFKVGLAAWQYKVI